jgi:KUP system potassium uptake protein
MDLGEKFPFLPKLQKILKEMIQSLGLVFGDIGTSPIYTLSIIFFLTPKTEQNILGVLSLIAWTLLLLVILQYIIIVLELGKKGEGGTIVLKELLTVRLKKGKHIFLVSILSFIGISLLFGDGVLTPAMGILSALEGIKFITFMPIPSHTSLLVFATGIAVILFVLQKIGIEKVAAIFGPLMLVWFSSLFITGALSVSTNLPILRALNPYYAITFFINNGIASFFILSDVILCATGAEAIYADMGHLGVKPIRRTSFFVIVTLLLSYFGQGAYLLAHPNTKQILYAMVSSQTIFLYTPFLILSLFATVVASQAMISGIFSSVYQSITTNILPRLKIDYTSQKFRSQIYIGIVNWFLLSCVIVVIWHFQASNRLASAYGLAVTGTMTITSIMVIWIFFLQKRYIKLIISCFLGSIVLSFFLANLIKIPHGGYWSIILAMIPLSLILIYYQGSRKIRFIIKYVSINKFLTKYTSRYQEGNSIPGTALFFVKNTKKIAPYVIQTMFKNNIIYEQNVILSIVTRDDPFGIVTFFKESLAPGLKILEIHMGYMEIPNIEQILQKTGISPLVIFYGQKEIVTKNLFWKLFGMIKQFSPTIVQFYKLAPHKMHGVVTLVKIDK